MAIKTLKGLSTSDRDLMLAMMAGLGSAAQTIIKVSQLATSTGEVELASQLDEEANALIDLCKKAKDRLKPGGVLVVGKERAN